MRNRKPEVITKRHCYLDFVTCWEWTLTNRQTRKRRSFWIRQCINVITCVIVLKNLQTPFHWQGFITSQSGRPWHQEASKLWWWRQWEVWHVSVNNVQRRHVAVTITWFISAMERLRTLACFKRVPHVTLHKWNQLSILFVMYDCYSY